MPLAQGFLTKYGTSAVSAVLPLRFGLLGHSSRRCSYQLSGEEATVPAANGSLSVVNASSVSSNGLSLNFHLHLVCLTAFLQRENRPS